MAEELHDGEFWLPPMFLAEDSLIEKKAKVNSNNNNNNGGDGGGYYFGNAFFANSDLSSPVESVVGSTEAESDEDEFFSGFTKKLALSCVSDDDLWKTDHYYEKNKSWRMGTSPQSTLSSVLVGGCGCNNMKQQNGSSRGSPTCPSPQPQTTSFRKNGAAAWELLHAAAGEVAKMRLIEERVASIKMQNQNLGVFANQSLSFYQKQQLQQLQANQFQQLKQQQMLKQQQGRLNLGQQQMGHKNGRSGSGVVGNGRTLGLSPNVWPTLQQSQKQQLPPPKQQQQGSGMRAVFLGNPATKRECSGTGVFLPRRVGTPTETLKKPVCSTVLLPNRVVQALNLNLEAMDANSQLRIRTISNNAGFTPNYDAALKYRNNVLAEQQAQQRRNVVLPPPVHMNNELRLPQEWTY